MPKRDGISQRAYARHRKELGLPGSSLRAVQVAIESARLVKSIGPRGRIIDAAMADAEWAANTHSDRVPLTGPTSKAPAMDYGEARARREAAEAELAEIELAKEKGEVVAARDVAAAVADDYSQVRTKLLGIPTRVRQRDPTMSTKQIAIIESVVREALEGLADEFREKAAG